MFGTRLALTGSLLFTCVALLAPSEASAAPPLQFSGDYVFDCADASLSVSLLLAGGAGQGGSGQGGTSAVPVYCDAPPQSWDETTPDDVVAAWEAYQARLDAARADFEVACNNLTQHNQQADCADAALEWRAGLAQLNDEVAGLVPSSLAVSVHHGTWANDAFGIWNTYSTLVLQNGQSVSTDYLIDRGGKVWSANLSGSANLASDQAGCAGSLAAVSEGHLRVEGGSSLRNTYGGLLSCGVYAGDLWLNIAATVSVVVRGVEAN